MRRIRRVPYKYDQVILGPRSDAQTLSLPAIEDCQTKQSRAGQPRETSVTINRAVGIAGRSIRNLLFQIFFRLFCPYKIHRIPKTTVNPSPDCYPGCYASGGLHKRLTIPNSNPLCPCSDEVPEMPRMLSRPTSELEKEERAKRAHSLNSLRSDGKGLITFGAVLEFRERFWRSHFYHFFSFPPFPPWVFGTNRLFRR